MKACPQCKSRATKIVHISAADKPIECQVCGHRYALPRPPEPLGAERLSGYAALPTTQDLEVGGRRDA